MKNKLKLVMFCLFITTALSSQVEVNKWSGEMELWRCKSDPNFIITYKINIGEGGKNSFIEINGPTKMDSMQIKGVLKILPLSAAGNLTSRAVKTQEIFIDQAGFSKEFVFDFENISQVSFEAQGDCSDLKNQYRSLKKTNMQFPKKDSTEVKPKTKTAKAGVRG
jgi:hypothetical protein